MRELKSLFSKYELTDAEVTEGSIFNVLQKAVIQNTLAQIVEEKLLLQFTPDNIAGYQQQEAEMQGQIRLLQSLLALSDEAQEVVALANMNPND